VLAVMIGRMGVAAALGAVVAFRPWRRLMRWHFERPESGAQVLIAVSGGLMTAVIGNNVALAFALVGLGGFIRFRSGIKDPRDAAVMFVMIGVGMACGLGAVPMALVATLFAGVVLAIFDASQRARPRLTRVAVAVSDPRKAFAHIRAVFPSARVLELPNTNPEPGRVVMELVLGETIDAASILRMLDDKEVPGVRSVSLEEGKAA